MAKSKILFQTNINRLRKVAQQIHLRQTMTYTQIILRGENEKKIREAEAKIYEAVRILETII